MNIHNSIITNPLLVLQYIVAITTFGVILSIFIPKGLVWKLIRGVSIAVPFGYTGYAIAGVIGSTTVNPLVVATICALIGFVLGYTGAIFKFFAWAIKALWDLISWPIKVAVAAAIIIAIIMAAKHFGLF